MIPAWIRLARQTIDADSFQKARDYARANGPGIAGSVFLHGLGLALILFYWVRAGSQLPQTATPFLPVEIVQLGDETAAPPTPQRSLVPQTRATRIPVAQSSTPQSKSISPSGKAPPEDEVEARLRRLAQLRQPDAVLSLDNDSVADTDSTNGTAGDDATYSLRDFVRAQVERRWSLNLDALGKRNFSILVHIEMTRKGAITLAEIVDKQRFKTDAIYRDIAISARNAVILSSPIALPDGHYREVMDMVLNLNPRDTLR